MFVESVVVNCNDRAIDSEMCMVAPSTQNLIVDKQRLDKPNQPFANRANISP